VQAAIHEFIKTLAAKLGCPGLADRAENLFNVAMDRGKLRWGRKAKLTAASALAIACREAHRSDPLRELAVALLFTPSDYPGAHIEFNRCQSGRA
jgi:transcription factor IIIB subunit 2